MSQGEEIGRRVKAARIARGLTQAGLAKLTGVKQQQIARIELGRTEFSRALPALSSVLDLELPIPDWLARASRSALPAPELAQSLAAIGGRLKAARKARGLGQVEAATAGGTTQSTVSKWESGEQSPEAIPLARYCGALGISVAEALGESPSSDVLRCLRAYVREHGKREGLLDALLPPERQDEPIGLAMKLIESLTREDHS